MMFDQFSRYFYSKVLGVHLNMYMPQRTGLVFVKQMLAGIFPSLFLKDNEIPKLTPAGEIFIKVIRESGYMHLQSTKPDTIGWTLKHISNKQFTGIGYF